MTCTGNNYSNAELEDWSWDPDPEALTLEERIAKRRFSTMDEVLNTLDLEEALPEVTPGSAPFLRYKDMFP